MEHSLNLYCLLSKLIMETEIVSTRQQPSLEKKAAKCTTWSLIQLENPALGGCFCFVVRWLLVSVLRTFSNFRVLFSHFKVLFNVDIQ